MQKIVIDTNIIVSSLIQRGYSNLIVNDFFVEHKFQLCISEELMAEYYEVLARPKFSKFQDFFIRAEALLAQIETNAIMYVPTIKLDLISDDDDNMILELADVCMYGRLCNFWKHEGLYLFNIQAYQNCNTKRILG